jgi:hypothetical protein
MLHPLVHPAVEALVHGGVLCTESAKHVAMFSPGLTLLLELDREGEGGEKPSGQLTDMLKSSLAICKACFPSPSIPLKHYDEDINVPWCRRMIQVSRFLSRDSFTSCVGVVKLNFPSLVADWRVFFTKRCV